MSTLFELEQTGKAPLVLVVDDDAMQRVIARDALEGAGFRVEEAGDGTEGLAAIEREAPNLVLLDVMMPVMDGFELCTRLRQEPQFANLPVLMVTGLEDVGSIERAFEVGTTDFLTKPINWVLLGYHVKCLLRAYRMEQDLRVHQAISEAKSDFIANMSHELRTPLNAIMGFSDVMKSEVLGPLGSASYRTYAKDIHDSGARLLEVIDDILDISKVDSNQIELAETRIDVADLIERALRLATQRACDAQIALSSEIPAGLKPLYADRRLVLRALTNLLSNAIKFTPKGGTVMTCAKQTPDGGLSIVVEDDGIGIASEYLRHILLPFAQVESALTRQFQGTGLGLPLTKSVAELHGGSLEMQSALNKGTRATIHFPSERVMDDSMILAARSA